MAQPPAAQQASTLTLTFGGKAIDAKEWPAQLGGATRSAAAGTSNAAAQRFLPPDYLEVLGAWDLSRSARDAAGGGEQSVAVAPGQLLMLELPDGSTLYTSGERLQQALEQMGSAALTAEAPGGGTRSLNLDRLHGTSADASRGLLETLGGLVSRIFLLGTRGPDGIVDAALQHLRELGEEALADKIKDGAAWGASYLATRALMWAIERQLDSPPGLHRWVGSGDAAATLLPVTPAELAADAAQGPLLVFIHGTASSTQGSFADLRSAAEAARLDWTGLQSRYGSRILALEHRTFSESPIENALALARMLPSGAQIDLVTHSRGGIVGDLMTLDWSDADRNQEWIESYERFLNRDLALDADDLKEADRRDRADLYALAAEWRSRRWQVGRYVRVAAPVGGTRLAAGNIDLFLSCLLSLIGLIPALQVSPLFHALKRITLEVARSRTDPNRVPGLEAMLPGSPMARLLSGATPQAGLRLGVIAGDVKGAPRFWRLAELLTDWVAFGREGNDLVVDTDSMATGVARSGQAARKFVEGAQVSHFNYFADAESRRAMTLWLTAATQAQDVAEFEPIGWNFLEYGSAAGQRSPGERGQRASTDRRPVVIVLPGIMGTHLAVGGQRIWFNPLQLLKGGLKQIRYQGEKDGRAAGKAEVQQLFDSAYGDLCQHLEDQGHRVLTFPYDWRRPLPATADQLATLLNQTLTEAEPGRSPSAAAELPVRILAHSMGGLVVRAMAARHPQLWQRFIGREGARFVMLGTPNRGSHQMVEMLLGKGDTVRQLAMLDLKLKLQGVLDIVAGFPGAVSLLPHPSLQVPGSLAVTNYLNPQIWIDWKPQVFDFWFGDRRVGVPTDAARDGAAELWALDGLKQCRLPVTAPQQERVVYVAGRAERTACGVALAGGRLKMLGSARGDGSVLWQSGRIDGIGAVYQMDVPHGDLAASADHFPALTELLTMGRTRRLREGWPVEAQRGIEADVETLSTYDAGPTTYPTDEALLAGLLGPTRRRGRGGRKSGPSPLQVTCSAMDLIHATAPVLVGHYQQDPISGAEGVIDRQLVGGELTTRHHLGLYPGAIGSATVVLLDNNEAERRRGSQRGAVVTGLGEMGQLSAGSLTEAVRSAALRYLLSTVERAGGLGGDGEATAGATTDPARQPPLEIGLATLLLGHNSTANIEIADSVRALLSGVLEANRQFDQVRRSGRKVRITRLEIIERYLDVAITATRALQSVAEELNADAGLDGSRIHAAAELQQGEGWRPRLAAAGGDNYWPRLIVTEAQPNCPDEVADDSGTFAGANQAPVPLPGQRSTSRRAGIADRLRYVYLAQRARAETEVLQRQPGLIEKLVQMSIHQPGRTVDLSRTLFQLMVPLDFKEAARQTDRLALLVDDRTANMPWELLSSDGVEPMVARTAMVRQFETSQWRRRPRSTVDRLAYVVGNPSTKGFKEAFSAPERPIDEDPVNLPGAEAEARSVSTLLRNGGYQPTEAIGPRESALEVINRLFQRPYRIVHIAAHGEFELQAADGSLRSGVLLSDGLLLTAAEIDQMEVVPDLVFLNCCHLGVVDSDGPPRDATTRRRVPYHRLAASLARQLIDMGVRAVVVAGWAVDDAAAKLFAETFYQGLLQQRLPFGMAVAEARRAVLKAHPGTNTWGAYQAYGDPGFLIDPTMGQDSGSAAAPPPSSARQEPPFVAPQELVDALEQLEERQKARNTSSAASDRSPAEFAALKRRVDGLLRRAPPGADWAERGDVACAIGALYAAFGSAGYTEAIAHLARAAQHENEAQRVPLKAVETLANLESRHGERQGDQAAVSRAAQRLSALVEATQTPSSSPSTATPERYGLLGSAFKRKAAMLARSGATSPEDLRKALQDAADWYRLGQEADLYPRLNRLTLEALLAVDADTARSQSAAEDADDITREAAARFAKSRDYFDALMPADAAVAKAIASGRLDDPRTRPMEVESLYQQYEAARRSLPESGRAFDSVLSNLELLALFANRLGPPARAAALQLLASRWATTADSPARPTDPSADHLSNALPEPSRTAAVPPSPAKPKKGKKGKEAATVSKDRGADSTAALPAGQVSAHFSLQELTASDTARARGIANQPGPAELRRMKALCEQVLEPLRTALGKPVTINSCYRSPELNKAVGGAANSQHVSGQAADIKVGGMTVLALFQHILQQGLPFDQLIYEAASATSQWVHISYNADGNRGQILNAVFKPGQRTTYQGLNREQALALKPGPTSRSARSAAAAAEIGYEESGDEPEEDVPGTAPAPAPEAGRGKRKGTGKSAPKS